MTNFVKTRMHKYGSKTAMSAARGTMPLLCCVGARSQEDGRLKVVWVAAEGAWHSHLVQGLAATRRVCGV